MSRRRTALFALVLSSTLARFVTAQTPPASDPQALTYAAQSIAAMTGGNSISDVTLTGNVTYSSGDDESGTATLMALGSAESRIDLSLPSGTRTEIRDAQTGTALGKWVSPSGTSGNFAGHNCVTDAAWFFPILGSLASNSSIVLSYIGQETRNGSNVQHLQSYVYQSNSSAMTVQQLSTMNFYLDATTLLPTAITFNSHPDIDANTNFAVEVDFSNYQTFSGINVPAHIQKYVQGTLAIDLTVTGATFNTGLSLSNFTIN